MANVAMEADAWKKRLATEKGRLSKRGSFGVLCFTEIPLARIGLLPILTRLPECRVCGSFI
jgi:hypothetical protein